MFFIAFLPFVPFSKIAVEGCPSFWPWDWNFLRWQVDLQPTTQHRPQRCVDPQSHPAWENSRRRFLHWFLETIHQKTQKYLPYYWASNERLAIWQELEIIRRRHICTGTTRESSIFFLFLQNTISCLESGKSSSLHNIQFSSLLILFLIAWELIHIVGFISGPKHFTSTFPLLYFTSCSANRFTTRKSGCRTCI